MEAVFFARARKTSLTFLKNKIFTSGQKHRERIGNAFPKHPKTSKTDQNSKSYPKKTEGWASNSRTQFSYAPHFFDFFSTLNELISATTHSIDLRFFLEQSYMYEVS